MKLASILAAVVALTVLATTTALAAHGAKAPSAPVPAHGSIWFGDGLERYGGLPTGLVLPAHGSIWFGEGLSQITAPAD